MNPLTQSKNTTILPLLIPPVLVCFALLPGVQAVVPAPDGGYPGFNTAERQNALFSLTTGVANTAVGWRSLFSDADGSFNTGVGAGTLLFNIGDQGAFEGVDNTAIGAAALLFNTTGTDNTATGAVALLNNTEGHGNTATGFEALYSNTTGFLNTANGISALNHNTTGYFNTALGYNAGYNLTTGNGNVCIGAGVIGVAGEDNTTHIRNIYASAANARVVYVNDDNKIGTLASSRRFKEEIKPMEQASELLFALKPVSFRYKKEFDAGRVPMFGLIAEDVERVDPDLVSRNGKGEVESVRYEQINAMLLNEFLKEHRRIEQQQATIRQLESTVAQQRKDFQAILTQLTARLDKQAAQIQKVSAQLELNKLAPQTVKNTD